MLSRNQIRASKRTQVVFCRVKQPKTNTPATDACLPEADHGPPTIEPPLNLPAIVVAPTEMVMEVDDRGHSINV